MVERNLKLSTKKRFLKEKLEVTTQKLFKVMELAPLRSDTHQELRSPSMSPKKFSSVARRESSRRVVDPSEIGSPSKFGRVSGLSDNNLTIVTIDEN